MKLPVVLGVLLFLSSLGERPMQTAAAQANPLSLSWEPAQLVNGSPCVFRVKAEKPLRALSGEWQDRQVFFDFDRVSGTWYGFAGVDLETPAGRHSLELKLTFADGARSSSSHLVTVGRGAYRNVTLRVARKFLEPDAETLARIKQEQELKREAFHRTSSNQFGHLWNGSFSAPVANIVTEPFGVRRTFNRKLQSVHQGLDFRADTGTPVQAMNSGEVILAREMFFEGGFVVLDHGQGLLTMYMHLSRINVKEGERLAKSQVLGLSGATGRATAPHLRVGVRWQTAYLDPAA
ncbi:MAG TPA: M23 family metallopeptidase, partial [Blastocatellia bacterium]|nr:M23 family metallopeptidase [Blastocatellia bacterium]